MKVMKQSCRKQQGRRGGRGLPPQEIHTHFQMHQVYESLLFRLHSSRATPRATSESPMISSSLRLRPTVSAANDAGSVDREFSETAFVPVGA